MECCHSAFRSSTRSKFWSRVCWKKLFERSKFLLAWAGSKAAALYITCRACCLPCLLPIFRFRIPGMLLNHAGLTPVALDNPISKLSADHFSIIVKFLELVDIQSARLASRGLPYISFWVCTWSSRSDSRLKGISSHSSQKSPRLVYFVAASGLCDTISTFTSYPSLHGMSWMRQGEFPTSSLLLVVRCVLCVVFRTSWYHFHVQVMQFIHPLEHLLADFAIRDAHQYQLSGETSLYFRRHLWISTCTTLPRSPTERLPTHNLGRICQFRGGANTN